MKVKLTLDPETLRLLKVEALGRSCSVSEVVRELVRSAPRRYVLMDRGSKGPVASEVSGPGGAEGVQRPLGAVGALGLVSEAG